LMKPLPRREAHRASRQVRLASIRFDTAVPGETAAP